MLSWKRLKEYGDGDNFMEMCHLCFMLFLLLGLNSGQFEGRVKSLSFLLCFSSWTPLSWEVIVVCNKIWVVHVKVQKIQGMNQCCGYT